MALHLVDRSVSPESTLAQIRKEVRPRMLAHMRRRRLRIRLERAWPWIVTVASGLLLLFG